MRIEICATMGTGKTTVARALVEYYNTTRPTPKWTSVEEDVDNHPFLKDFYADMAKYSFEVDVHAANTYSFNVKKYEGQNTVFDGGGVMNRSYGALTPSTEEEKAAKESVYALADNLPPPDLIIFLDLPVEKVFERIASRGRGMEEDIPKDYINSFRAEIEKQLAATNVPVLRVKMEDLDFINNKNASVVKLAGLIRAKLRAATPANTNNRLQFRA